jgi:transcription factor E2F7/8
VRDGRRTEEFSRRELLRQKILSYNRKEKSLEELSRRFIDNFEGRTGLVLELDKVTLQLRVERRRIYDIVNIYESLQVVRKAAKNNYVWRGLSQAVATIAHLRVAGPDAPLSGKKEKSLENLAARFLRLFLFS